ncbi:hypothetical protein N7451_008901 [Penicillium sp. IBT 35674x]|nr:hypothetical protein N7451_008901 [Penicillium sp. IBT 35674x]
MSTENTASGSTSPVDINEIVQILGCRLPDYISSIEETTKIAIKKHKTMDLLEMKVHEQKTDTWHTHRITCNFKTPGRGWARLFFRYLCDNPPDDTILHARIEDFIAGAVRTASQEFFSGVVCEMLCLKIMELIRRRQQILGVVFDELIDLSTRIKEVIMIAFAASAPTCASACASAAATAQVGAVVNLLVAALPLGALKGLIVKLLMKTVIFAQLKAFIVKWVVSSGLLAALVPAATPVTIVAIGWYQWHRLPKSLAKEISKRVAAEIGRGSAGMFREFAYNAAKSGLDEVLGGIDDDQLDDVIEVVKTL